MAKALSVSRATIYRHLNP
ncbi:hypothetical protein [Cryobacterium sp.]